MRRKVLQLLVAVVVGVLASSCQPTPNNEPFIDLHAEGYQCARAVSHGAQLYFRQHGQFPDSLSDFIQYVKLPSRTDVRWSRHNTIQVIDRTGDRVDPQIAVYRPVIQYRGNTVAGEENRQVLGYQVVTIAPAFLDNLVIDGRFDHEGRLVVIVY